MATFKDHFSTQADTYTQYRPTYPAALFDYLATLVPTTGRVWDVGTGNGQAAVDLAERFDEVIATDPSERQIEHARKHPKVRYLVAPAEKAPLDDSSVDLVTVAQALHWFDFDRFYDEVRRVARPGAILAAWTYLFLRVEPAVDAVLDDIYKNVTGPYWPPERKHVDVGYASIPFPVEELRVPPFETRASWTLAHLLGYIGTWSATARCQQSTGRDVVAEVMPALTRVWGDPEASKEVCWELVVRVGRVSV